MNPAIRSMLDKYKCETRNDYENALKEIIQEVALLGLWRSKFFQHAAFYGGTSLRILYGLDRFSEDIDFSLHIPVQVGRVFHSYSATQNDSFRPPAKGAV